MAHIHLEDGSFTLFWVLFWWACAVVVIGAALVLLRSRRKPTARDITIAAFLTATSFALFQVSIPVFGGVHLNFTPLIGILAGPVMGPLIVFIANILSAALGHGGWGLIGANVLVNFSEVLAAYLVWRGLQRAIPLLSARAGIAAFVSLLCGNFVMVAIVLLSGVQGATQTPTETLAGLSLLVGINMAVAVVEAIVTGLVVGYIGKVRPDLLSVSRS